MKANAPKRKIFNDAVDLLGGADAIMDGLLEYAELATDVRKDCVKKAGNTVKKKTQANAPAEEKGIRELEEGIRRGLSK